MPLQRKAADLGLGCPEEILKLRILLPATLRSRTLALAASLLVHILIGAFLVRAPLPKKTNEIRPIRVIASTQPTPPPPAASSHRPGPQKKAPAKRGASQGRNSTQTLSGHRTYSEFLPGGTWQPHSAEGHYASRHGGEGRSILTSTGVLPSTQMLLGELQIPFIYRRKSASTRAVAVITLHDGGNSPVMDTLDGDPTLRAVLYEALIKERGRRFLADWAQRMKRQSIVITLQMKTATIGDNRRDIEEDIGWNGEVLRITRVFSEPPGGPKGPGIPLPDEEQIRGDRRDRRELNNLRSSPAYTSPLRNKIL